MTALVIPEAVARLRARRPLVHMITNLISMGPCAYAVRALGAATIFAHAPEEAVEVAQSADAVVINIGTSIPGAGQAGIAVARGCRTAGIPVVLDPLGCGVSAYRRQLTQDLLDTGAVTVVSGNAAELATLCGIESTMRGADSVATAAACDEIAIAAARSASVITALSGRTDYVSDGDRLVAITNGHAVMGQVVGTGSARSAVLGAFVAVAEGNAFGAAITGTCAYGIAGERAAAYHNGPGYFLSDLYNALASLEDGTVLDNAQIIERAWKEGL